MFLRTLSTHIKIVNVGLIYGALLMIGSYFDHWPTVERLTWINSFAFFLLFLQSFFISRKEIVHKSLFINLAIWTLLSSLQILNPFVGPGYALGGSAELAYELIYCRGMIMPFLVSYVILSLVVNVLSRGKRPWLASLASFLLMSCAAVFLFRSVLFESPLINASRLIIAQQALKMLCLPLLALAGYWIYQFKHDYPLSEHIKVLLGFFFVYVIIELTDLATTVYELKLYEVSQVVLFSVLSFLAITLYNRLNYISSEFGRYFEGLLATGNPSGVPIVRKESHSLKPVFGFLRKYVAEKPVHGGLAVVAAALIMMYVRIPAIAMINMAAVGIAFLLLFTYWWGLSRKRISENNIMKFEQKPTLT